MGWGKSKVYIEIKILMSWWRRIARIEMILRMRVMMRRIHMRIGVCRNLRWIW